LADFKNFFTATFSGKFAIKWSLEIPPLLKHVATLPCEILVVKTEPIQQRVNNKTHTHIFCHNSFNARLTDVLIYSAVLDPGTVVVRRRRRR